KVCYDLLAAREAAGAGGVASVRAELLYPFSAKEIQDVLGRYADDVEIVWAQEEPRNMGAWTFVAPRLIRLVGRDVGYIGRPPRASPAEGYADSHEKEQRRITTEAVT